LPAHADDYRQHTKAWTDNLKALYPGSFSGKRTRTNIHAIHHISDFMMLFGPVISWWELPFESLIGKIQKVTTNNRIGGALVFFSFPPHLLILVQGNWSRQL
jgi:hypothetical protein